ncbi:hypothetical protein HY991_03330, partial [Candidatus Micrarchaeota archaeon]|nr:hypothetical protein [Candidatus Micrarchaeota archaeon]
PVPYDRPLRVDFLDTGKGSSEETVEVIQRVSSLIYSLSKLNKNYAHPAVLIEADLCAALNPEEIERTYNTLFSVLGPKSALFKLRRNIRPFR